MRRSRSIWRTSMLLDRSARVTVKKKVPPSTYARRYRGMTALDYHLPACVLPYAWARRARARLCPPYRGPASIHQPEHFPRPAARIEPFLHVQRHRRSRPDRLAILVERHHHLAGMQVQRRPAVARRGAVDAVADDRPTGGGAMHAQLMGAAGERLERQPGDVLRGESR